MHFAHSHTYANFPSRELEMSRQVPWKGWDEWREVESLLFSGDDQRRQQGIDRVGAHAHALSRRAADTHAHAQVAAWRVRGRVPLAIDTTASLVEAGMMYETYQTQKKRRQTAPDGKRRSSVEATAEPHRYDSIEPSSEPLISEYTLRIRYALPLIKLVNGVADSQQKGRAAASVAVLSEVAGLPRFERRLQ